MTNKTKKKLHELKIEVWAGKPLHQYFYVDKSIFKRKAIEMAKEKCPVGWELNGLNLIIPPAKVIFYSTHSIEGFSPFASEEDRQLKIHGENNWIFLFDGVFSDENRTTFLRR